MVKKLQKHRRFFSLVEVMVAMAVFAVFAMLTVQFFTASKKAWLGMDQKIRIASAANIGLDLMTDMLRSIQIHTGSPFMIMQSEGGGDILNNRIAFLTNAPNKILRSSQSNAHMVLFWVDTFFDKENPFAKGDIDSGRYLMINVVGDLNPLVPPEETSSVEKLDIFKAATSSPQDMMAHFLRKPKNSADLEKARTGDFLGRSFEIVPYVTDLKFIPLRATTVNDKNPDLYEMGCMDCKEDLTAAGHTHFGAKDSTLAGRKFTNEEGVDAMVYVWDKVPDAIRVELSLMSERDYQRWQKLQAIYLQSGDGADLTRARDFMRTHEQTFSRIVYLGDRKFL